MENKNIKVRIAKIEDAKELLAIYAPYVKNTAITFEYDVPSLQEFEYRIATILKRYPYLVAEQDGEIIGYAYVGAFHERAALNWAVETSIYIHQGKKQMGIGRRLYDTLEMILKEQNILNMNACIAYPEVEDEYLTKDSVRFHTHMGFSLVGEFHKCGYKFQRWYHMVWMEKHIGKHKENQPSVKPFPEVLDIVRNKYNIQ